MSRIARRSVIAGAMAAPALIAASARAQGSIAGGRPIRLVVPFPPGGAVDLLGRLLAEKLQPILGNQFVVDNRGGAGGNLGADNVAKSAPDGTTIGLIGSSILCANEFLYTRLPFNPRTDFTPISRTTWGTVLCVANANTARERGWNSFRDLLAWSKANPEKVSMGSSGVGTTSHFMIALVNQRTGAAITHVPYRGGGPAITDLISGTIDIMFDVMPALMPHVNAGRFRALAVGSIERLPILPDIPGMKDHADLGLGDIDMVSWNAVVGPAGMPADVTNTLNRALNQVMADPTTVEKLAPLGYFAVSDPTPAALARHIEQERPRWEAIVKLSGARVE
jgi:tripartite-type tricarboxylate transporter receptor subunit TctC